MQELQKTATKENVILFSLRLIFAYRLVLYLYTWAVEDILKFQDFKYLKSEQCIRRVKKIER